MCRSQCPSNSTICSLSFFQSAIFQSCKFSYPGRSCCSQWQRRVVALGLHSHCERRHRLAGMAGDCCKHNHRRSHPMGPVGCVSQLCSTWVVGTKAIFGTVFFSCFSWTGYGNPAKHARRTVDIATEKQSVNMACLCRVHRDDRGALLKGDW